MVHEAIQAKEKQVNELADKIKKSNTLMIVSIRGLPSKQFQEIKKSVRSDAFVKIARKNIILRALEKCGDASIKPLENHIESDVAIVLSDKDGYDLAAILGKKKTKVFAKAGQIADDNIEVKDGPTELVPGPVISEFGVLGVQIAVENGKIAIKSPKVVVKKGEEIKENVASLLQKLSIQPFSVGLNPLVIYDLKKRKLYTHIKIDPEGYTHELKKAASQSLGFAQKISFYCKETIGYFLAKANMQGTHLQNKLSQEEK
ncbi:MAG: hypothetical protein RL557_345 [archaeon]|jgi:large subunit ribosomal protein L10